MSSKRFWSVLKFIRQVFQKGVLRVQRNILRENKALKKNCYGFSNLRGQLEGIQGNFIDKMSKLQSSCQDEQFEELYAFLEKTFLQIKFGNWTEKCWIFRETHRHDRQNCALHLQMMFLKRMCKLYCPKLIHFCGSLDENFQPFHENFNRCVKAEFYVLREAFRKNMSLFRESLFFLFRT